MRPEYESIHHKIQRLDSGLPAMTTSRDSNIIRAPREPWVDIEFQPKRVLLTEYDRCPAL